jgi:hypothetical protein
MVLRRQPAGYQCHGYHGHDRRVSLGLDRVDIEAFELAQRSRRKSDRLRLHARLRCRRSGPLHRRADRGGRIKDVGAGVSKFGVPFQIVTNEPEFALISISEMVASFGIEYRFEVSTG